MSRENLEVVRRFYEAFNRGDFGRAAQYLHPAGEVYPAVVGFDPGIGSNSRFRGPEELRQYFEDFGETFEAVTVEPEETIEASRGRVLAVERWHVRGREGVEVETKIIDVYAFRDGLIVRVDGFLDRAEALEAVGLRE